MFSLKLRKLKLLATSSYTLERSRLGIPRRDLEEFEPNFTFTSLNTSLYLDDEH